MILLKNSRWLVCMKSKQVRSPLGCGGVSHSTDNKSARKSLQLSLLLGNCLHTLDFSDPKRLIRCCWVTKNCEPRTFYGQNLGPAPQEKFQGTPMNAKRIKRSASKSDSIRTKNSTQRSGFATSHAWFFTRDACLVSCAWRS